MYRILTCENVISKGGLVFNLRYRRKTGDNNRPILCPRRKNNHTQSETLGHKKKINIFLT